MNRPEGSCCLMLARPQRSGEPDASALKGLSINMFSLWLLLLRQQGSWGKSLRSKIGINYYGKIKCYKIVYRSVDTYVFIMASKKHKAV